MWLAWLVIGCCSTGRFPSKDHGATVPVKRDENVAHWRVNGEKVCPKLIWAAPGCYVLEVEYEASFTKYHPHKSGVGFFSPIAGAVEQAAQTTHHEYSSSRIPFALRLRENANYFVTATFTGDEFLPRIVGYDGAGNRLASIEPARSRQELEACAPGSGSAADLRVGLRVSDESSCD